MDKHHYANTRENAFLQFAVSHKWEITKRGWPDFLCKSKSGEWFAVEVKRKGERLKKAQTICFDFLTSVGVRCYVYDGENLFRYADKHRRFPRTEVFTK